MPKAARVFIDHHIAQLWGVDHQLLNHEGQLLRAALNIAQQLKLTVVKSFVHQFEPHGLSVVLVIGESHLAIHTWPELGYLHIDTLSCSKKADLTKLQEVLQQQFQPTRITSQKIDY